MSIHKRRGGEYQEAPTNEPVSTPPIEKSEVAETSQSSKNFFSREWIIRFLILRSVGNFLILFALFGVSMTLGPALYYEVLYQINQHMGVRYVVSTQSLQNQQSQLGKLQGNTNEKIITPPDTLFSVVIPKINASARVIPNVDPSNEAEYLAALKQGIAHAKGTVFPGMQGTSFFFAHSTDNFWDVGRYNAVFYLLKDMVVGDDVVIFFNNYRYNYKVTQTEILDPSDVHLLINAQKDKTQQVVLQTCWPPGTTWKRFIVIAKPVK